MALALLPASQPAHAGSISENQAGAAQAQPLGKGVPPHKGWELVASPNAVDNDSNHLYGAAAIKSDDVWAVGFYYTGQYSHTLTEHWNGRQWTIVSSPDVGEYGSGFYAAAAVSSNDVWAVGWYCTGVPCELYQTSPTHPLIEHWNGTTWSVVTCPDPGDDSILLSISPVGPNDIWAVGSYGFSRPGESLVEHWNGSEWSVVAAPSPGYYHGLFGVNALATNVDICHTHAGHLREPARGRSAPALRRNRAPNPDRLSC